jgi:hypothetical protein
VLARPKQGFSAPVADWAGGDLGALFERLLRDGVLRLLRQPMRSRRGIATRKHGRGGSTCGRHQLRALAPVLDRGTRASTTSSGTSVRPVEAIVA